MRQSVLNRHQIPWLIEAGSMVDHFRVMRPLGRGGMAEVYLARDTSLGRRVALKLLRTDLLDQRAPWHTQAEAHFRDLLLGGFVQGYKAIGL